MYSPRRVYKVGSPFSDIATCFGFCASSHFSLGTLGLPPNPDNSLLWARTDSYNNSSGSWSVSSRCPCEVHANSRCKLNCIGRQLECLHTIMACNAVKFAFVALAVASNDSFVQWQIFTPPWSPTIWYLCFCSFALSAKSMPMNHTLLSRLPLSLAVSGWAGIVCLNAIILSIDLLFAEK